MIYLIDGNCVLLGKDWNTGLYFGSQRISGVISFLRYIRSVFDKFGYPDEVFLVWDSRDERKNMLYSNYKKGRKTTDELFEKLTQISLIDEICHYLGVNTVRVEGVEADDVIGFITQRIDDKIYILSFDHDLYQCVFFNEDVSIVTKDNKLVTKNNFKKYTGLANLEEFILFKSIVGDSSDNIKGVEGIGSKRFKSMLDNYGVDFIKKKYKEVYLKNRQLVDLRYVDMKNRKVYFRLGNFDTDFCRSFFYRYKMLDFLKKFQWFIEPFRNLSRRKR